MRYKRAIIQVSIRLDGVPGWGHEPEDHVKSLQEQLPSWYYPEVKLIKVVMESKAKTERLWKEQQKKNEEKKIE